MTDWTVASRWEDRLDAGLEASCPIIMYKSSKTHIMVLRDRREYANPERAKALRAYLRRFL